MANIGGNITVRADSVRAEGDATARSYGGGVVDVGAAQADTTVTPTVNAYIDTGATIDVDGSVTVEALARAQPLENLRRHVHDRTRTTIDNDTIEFAQHGLANGDTVTYNPNGNPAIGTADGGTLQTGREYSVIATGENTLQLGGVFNARGRGHRRSLRAGRRRRRGARPHPLQRAARVRDRRRGEVRRRRHADQHQPHRDRHVLRAQARRLHDQALRRPQRGARQRRASPTATFGASAVDATNDTITIFGQRLRRQPRGAATARRRAREFRSTGVDVDGVGRHHRSRRSTTTASSSRATASRTATA